MMPVSDAELEAVVEAALAQPFDVAQDRPEADKPASRPPRIPPPWQMMLEPVLLSIEGTMADLAMLSIAISLTKIALWAGDIASSLVDIAERSNGSDD
jgi:hypothetical protein